MSGASVTNSEQREQHEVRYTFLSKGSLFLKKVDSFLKQVVNTFLRESASECHDGNV